MMSTHTCRIIVWSCSEHFLFSKFPSPFLFSQLCFIYFPPFIPTFVPLFFSPFYFPFIVTILSHFSKTAGSQVGGLADHHLHPYSHIMSPTDHCVIMYLIFFVTASSIFHIQNFAISILHPKIRDIHYDRHTCHGYQAPKHLCSHILSMTNRRATLSLFSITFNH
jgi:hypothetical protein